jgi:hypothetical protein
LGGRRRAPFGISTTVEDVCSLTLPLPYFRRSTIMLGRVWRLPFLAGLVLGGFSLGLVRWRVVADAGARNLRQHTIGLGPLGKLAWMFGAGLLIGFGTRPAGCNVLPAWLR